jgi:hypothetical protein
LEVKLDALSSASQSIIRLISSGVPATAAAGEGETPGLKERVKSQRAGMQRALLGGYKGNSAFLGSSPIQYLLKGHIPSSTLPLTSRHD